MKKAFRVGIVVLIIAAILGAVFIPKGNRFAIACGAGTSLKEFDNEEFLKGYVDKYGAKAFFDNYLRIQGNGNTDIDKDEFLRKAGIQEIKFDDSKVEKGDFYIKNPDAEPQDNSRTDSYKRRYSADHDVYEYSDNITYYGNFALLKTESTHYNPGRYEWSNGKFYDEPASISDWTSYQLYYKGKELFEKTDDPEELFERMKEFTLYDLNGDIICIKNNIIYIQDDN